MHIESGTTSWWRNRHLMFVVMFLGFGAYFAYDGYYAYPAKNLEWAIQAMGERPAGLQPNPRVSRSTCERLQADLKGRPISLNELKGYLGEPALLRGNEVWWVGSAMYVRGTITGAGLQLERQDSTQHRESDIWGQRAISAVMWMLALIVILKLVRVLRMKVVLDDAGLHTGGKHIPWDAMTGLRIKDYSRKYWVNLEYTAGEAARALRLDSFHIDKFDQIVGAICDRKGYERPVPAASETTESQ